MPTDRGLSPIPRRKRPELSGRAPAGYGPTSALWDLDPVELERWKRRSAPRMRLSQWSVFLVVVFGHPAETSSRTSTASSMYGPSFQRAAVAAPEVRIGLVLWADRGCRPWETTRLFRCSRLGPSPVGGGLPAQHRAQSMQYVGIVDGRGRLPV